MIKVFFDAIKNRYTIDLGGAVIETDPDDKDVILSLYAYNVVLVNGKIVSSKDGKFVILDKE